MDDSCFLYILAGQSHAEHAIVTGVIICAGDHIYARPGQFFREFRITAHPGAAAFRHWIRLVIVKQHLEVGECQVCRTNQFNHLQKFRFVVNRQFTRDNRIPG